MNNGSNMNKKRVATIKWIFYALLAVVFAADFFAERHHANFPWDNIPGFSAAYGFLSVVVIIIVSKVIGKVVVSKKEDYYD